MCRAWYTLIAPTLYSKLEVGDDVIGHPLRQSVARYARRIWVCSDRPIVTSARMACSAPHPSPAAWLQLWGPNQKKARRAAYHPSHAVIFSQLYRAYSPTSSRSTCSAAPSSPHRTCCGCSPPFTPWSESNSNRSLLPMSPNPSFDQGAELWAYFGRSTLMRTASRQACLLLHTGGHGPTNRPTTKHPHSMGYCLQNNSLWLV